MQTAKLKVPVNLIGGPYPLSGVSKLNLDISDNDLFSIWPIEIFLPNFDDFKPYCRYIFWLPGQYIWAGYANQMSPLNRIRVDKDTLNLMPEALRG